jgi:hypothetical protein
MESVPWVPSPQKWTTDLPGVSRSHEISSKAISGGIRNQLNKTQCEGILHKVQSILLVTIKTMILLSVAYGFKPKILEVMTAHTIFSQQQSF